MSIAAGQDIVYDDVVSDILQKIKSCCCNIDKYDVTDDDLIANKKWEIASAGPSHGSHSWTICGGGAEAPGYYVYYSYSIRIPYSAVGLQSYVSSNNNIAKAYFNSSVKSWFKQVSLEIVRNQLQNFLISRGVYSKVGQVITARGIMNVFNNIAIFLSLKLKAIKSINSGKLYIFYDPDNNDFFNPGIIDLHGEYDSNDNIERDIVITAYDALLKAFNETIDQTNKLILSYASSSSSSSSSCSSCSCSSSCSSSSSSSSSSYIVYMII